MNTAGKYKGVDSAGKGGEIWMHEMCTHGVVYVDEDRDHTNLGTRISWQ